MLICLQFQKEQKLGGKYMAELVALERILKEIDRIDLYLELLEKGDLDMLRHLLEREKASLQKAVEAK